MTTENLDLIKILASILGGGAIGAIITAVVTTRRNRIQPIGASVNLSESILPDNLVKDHVTKITISGATESYHYDNLYLASIEVLNKGNKDYESFDFGITLPDGMSIINVAVKSADRHHSIQYCPQVSFNSKLNYIDLTLSPFNRKDKYTISLTLTGTFTNVPNPILFSSKLPVKFVSVDFSELILPAIFKSLTGYVGVELMTSNKQQKL
jgi:hypothetical protein